MENEPRETRPFWDLDKLESDQRKAMTYIEHLGRRITYQDGQIRALSIALVLHAFGMLLLLLVLFLKT